jgi:hypothetical protein
MTWKRCRRKPLPHAFRYWPGICLEEMGKILKIMRMNWAEAEI